MNESAHRLRCAAGSSKNKATSMTFSSLFIHFPFISIIRSFARARQGGGKMGRRQGRQKGGVRMVCVRVTSTTNRLTRCACAAARRRGVQKARSRPSVPSDECARAATAQSVRRARLCARARSDYPLSRHACGKGVAKRKQKGGGVQSAKCAKYKPFEDRQARHQVIQVW